MSEECSPHEVQWIDEILHRIGADLSMVTDHSIRVGSSDVQRASARPVGEGQIHISFRLEIENGGRQSQGCVLLPLPEAVSLASYLMMVPEDEIRDLRDARSLDSSTREAIIEVGNFISDAAQAALRESGLADVLVRLEGCQGVRRDVRPALLYTEGDPLLVGRTRATIDPFPEFEITIMLPELAAD